MDGQYDDNFYFHNPVDYVANLNDPWILEQLAHRARSGSSPASGPWEESGHSYALSAVLAQKGIRHHLDDWGPRGGHDWPYWKDADAGVSGASGDDRRLGARRLGRPWQSNFSSRYCPRAITWSSSIQTSHSRVSTSTCVRDVQSACVWLP